MNEQTRPADNTPDLIDKNGAGQNKPAPKQRNTPPQDDVAKKPQNKPAPESEPKQIKATPRALKKKIFYKKVK